MWALVYAKVTVSGASILNTKPTGLKANQIWSFTKQNKLLLVFYMGNWFVTMILYYIKISMVLKGHPTKTNLGAKSEKHSVFGFKPSSHIFSQIMAILGLNGVNYP